MSTIVKSTGRKPSKAALKRAIKTRDITEFMWELLQYGITVFDTNNSAMTIKDVLEIVKEINKATPTGDGLPKQTDEQLESWVAGEE